jgi:Retrotransposon gag protein
VLCLSYITGPKVDAWVKQKREWLKSQVKHQRRSFNNEGIWEDFEEDFRKAFTDTDTNLTAFEKLHNLRMVGSDIDSYIAEFEWLREETGYRKDNLLCMDACSVLGIKNCNSGLSTCCIWTRAMYKLARRIHKVV